jgi:hypothetical protein
MTQFASLREPRRRRRREMACDVRARVPPAGSEGRPLLSLAASGSSPIQEKEKRVFAM